MDSDTILQQGKLTGNVVLHILIILSILYDINKTSWRIVNIAENNVLVYSIQRGCYNITAPLQSHAQQQH